MKRTKKTTRKPKANGLAIVRRSCAPMEARSLGEVCSLRTDNHDCKTGWIITDGHTVSLTNQKNGEQSTGCVKFTRAEFNKLIRWYTRPQKTVKRNYA